MPPTTSDNIVGDVYIEVARLYIKNRTGPWTAPLINTVGFPSLRSVTDSWKSLVDSKSSGDGIPRDSPESVKSGYEAQKRIKEQILSDDTGVFETLASSWGQLTVAAQKTFSRGVVRPSSSSIFDLPFLDPRYCSDPIDCEIMVLGLRLKMRLIQTEAMRELMPQPYLLFNTTDHDALMEEVHKGLVTERHPSGTPAMMPLDMGEL
ncbi:hypothetical protein ACJ41O_011146 [Fusarium nematophilum]